MGQWCQWGNGVHFAGLISFFKIDLGRQVVQTQEYKPLYIGMTRKPL